MLFTPFSPRIIYSAKVEILPVLSLCYRWSLRSYAKPSYNLFFCKHLSCPLASLFPPSFTFNLASLFIVCSFPCLPRLFLFFFFLCIVDVLRLFAKLPWLDTGEMHNFLQGCWAMGLVLLLLKGLVLLTHTGADVCIRPTHTTQPFVEKHLFVEIMQQCLKTDALFLLVWVRACAFVCVWVCECACFHAWVEAPF